MGGITEASAADARRAAVVALAADLFDRGGYASISMEQIAAAAGIAKPTLYHYFRSKDEILRGVHESFITTLLSARMSASGWASPRPICCSAR